MYILIMHHCWLLNPDKSHEIPNNFFVRWSIPYFSSLNNHDYRLRPDGLTGPDLAYAFKWRHPALDGIVSEKRERLLQMVEAKFNDDDYYDDYDDDDDDDGGGGDGDEPDDEHEDEDEDEEENDEDDHDDDDDDAGDDDDDDDDDDAYRHAASTADKTLVKLLGRVKGVLHDREAVFGSFSFWSAGKLDHFMY